MTDSFAKMVQTLSVGLWLTAVQGFAAGPLPVASGGSKLPESKSLSAVTLTFRPEIIFRHEPLLLSDLMACEGDSARCAELQELDFGVKVTPGKTQYITSAQLVEFLKIEWPQTQVTFGGPASARVNSPAKVLATEEVEAALATQLDVLTVGNTTLRLTVEKIQMTSPLIVMDEDHEILFPGLSDPNVEREAALRGITASMTVQARYKSKRGIQNFYIQPFLRIEEFAPVAKTAIQAGTVISKAHVERQWRLRPPGHQREAPVADLTDVYGLIAKRFIGAGSVMSLDALTQPILIKRGEQVRVSSGKNGIHVTMKATALGAGAAGQLIEVETIGAKRRVQARVLDSSSVEVAQW